MLMRGYIGCVFAKRRYLRGWRARQRGNAAAIVDRRRGAFEGLHEADGWESVIDKRDVVTGPAGAVFTQFWSHGHCWNIRAAPGADIAHHAAIGGCIVGSAVGIRAESLPRNTGGVKAEVKEIGGRVGRVVAPGNVRVQHRDHVW